ncbi:MAG TPA: flagellar biosynthetic protein FliO [Negativicutes bacterium]
MGKKPYRSYCIIVVICLITMIAVSQGYAEEAKGAYLKYQEPPAPAAASWLSTTSYVVSLLITFAVVLGLAYFSARFLGQKMGKLGNTNDNKVLSNLPLGPNRAVQVIEIAGKFLVIGVTDHTINLLQEITDPEEIEKMKQQPVTIADNQFDRVFQNQLASLQQISQKFPAVFGTNSKNAQENEQEKR